MSGDSGTDFVSLQPDRMIGRYRVVAVLGQGSFGITYRAVDSELGREVAIKEYLPAALAVRQDGTTVVPRSGSAAADFAWGRDRFIAEGRTLASFHRVPGVVQVHDFLEAHGTAYLVMELVRGRTLQDEIERQGPLDAARLGEILPVLLDGLEQVHAAGFLHRDIKPANILIDAAGRPVLIDFGASRAAVAGRSQAMTAIFTPGYAAVEQFTAATQGPWTDIYGLAATMHHALTGLAPPNAIDRVVDDTYVPLADGAGPAGPRSLLAGIDAGLAVRAADRPQSVAAWRQVLSAPATDTGGPAATVMMPRATSTAATMTTATMTTAATPGRRPAAMLAAGVVGLCLLAAGGWFALGGPATPAPPSPSPAPAAIAAAPSPPAPDPSPGPAPASTPAVAAVAPVPPPVPDRLQEQLDEARRAQQAAAEEAARLRAEADARRKADEEAALRQQIAEELRQKAAAEEAARRQAVEEVRRQAAAEAAAAAAARQQAEADARKKAEEEAAARRQAEEADLKGAEATETALHLGTADRQRIQTALTALGFPTGGSDGVLGPRSREMIAAWQRKAGRVATGYLSADSQGALLQDAAPALARQDEERRRLAAVPPAPTPSAAASTPSAAAPTPSTTPPTAAKGTTRCDGAQRVQWCRGAYEGFPPSCWQANATISNGVISGGWTSQASKEHQSFTGNIDAAGNVQVTFNGIGQQTHVNRRFTALMTGRLEGNVLTASGRAGPNGRDFTLTIQCR
ncbi:protein kinase domain-containing protein [Reyranella sp.]|uniref:protein kinase domain-containing protein n=1 Tax=Reyranella sp. TaxID=1929291 RepID=UPI003BAD4498